MIAKKVRKKGNERIYSVLPASYPACASVLSLRKIILFLERILMAQPLRILYLVAILHRCYTRYALKRPVELTDIGEPQPKADGGY